MDDPLQPTITPTVKKEIVAPPTQPAPNAPRVTPEVIAAVIVIAIGALLLLGLRIFASQKPKIPVIVEKPIPTPTPTPVRLPSALASQSAFLKLEANVASLSGAIKNYVVDDPSLSPPVLELPLGFQ